MSCKSLTKKGLPCKNKVSEGNKHCSIHQQTFDPESDEDENGDLKDFVVDDEESGEDDESADDESSEDENGNLKGFVVDDEESDEDDVSESEESDEDEEPVNLIIDESKVVKTRPSRPVLHFIDESKEEVEARLGYSDEESDSIYTIKKLITQGDIDNISTPTYIINQRWKNTKSREVLVHKKGSLNYDDKWEPYESFKSTFIFDDFINRNEPTVGEIFEFRNIPRRIKDELRSYISDIGTEYSTKLLLKECTTRLGVKRKVLPMGHVSGRCDACLKKTRLLNSYCKGIGLIGSDCAPQINAIKILVQKLYENEGEISSIIERYRDDMIVANNNKNKKYGNEV